jgi:predicted helicase
MLKLFGQIIKQNRMNFENINNLDDFIKRSSKDKNNGYLFEVLCKYVLLCHYTLSSEIKDVWLYKEIPTKIKSELGLPTNDKGIDLLVCYKDNSYKVVQCKFRTTFTNTVSYTELSTFFAQLFLTNDSKEYIKGVYMTTTYENCNEINNTNRIMAFNYDFFETLDKEFFDAVRKRISENKKLKYKNIKLRPYQKECVDKVILFFRENSRCHTIMPCGTGKSIISYNIDKEMKNTKTLVLVPSLYLLSQIYNTYSRESYNSKVKYLLVGSDADDENKQFVKDIDYTTDQTIINKFIDKYVNDKIIIISTYQSSELLKNKEFDLIIFDEAHKTVNKEKSFFNFALNDDCIKSNKRLFMTATKKVYANNDEEIICMNNENLYGQLIYEYTLKNAIEQGFLTNYLIECMLIKDDVIKQYKINNNYIKINDNILNIDDTFEMHEIASAFMVKKLFENGSIKHLLTYHSKCSNAKNFMTLVEKISGIPSYYMDGKTSCAKRNKIVREFSKAECSVICSARVLNEGIDIPIVDSIMFIDGRQSQIDIIQCIGRSLRLYKDKDNARILLPVLEEELQEGTFGNIYNIIRTLKVYDTSIIDYFTNKSKGLPVNKKLINYTVYSNSENISGVDITYNDLEENIETNIVDFDNDLKWFDTLEKVKEFIETNKRKPSTTSINKNEFYLGQWISRQIKNYKNKKDGMILQERRRLWEEFIEEYKEYIFTFDDIWNNKLEKVKQFINNNKKKPSTTSKNKEEKELGQWIYQQTQNYRNQDRSMSIIDKRNIWETFKEEYKIYMMTKEELWNSKFENVKQYIKENKKRPSKKSDIIKIKQMGEWLTDQIVNYKKQIESMSTIERRNIFEEFSKECLEKYNIKILQN